MPHRSACRQSSAAVVEALQAFPRIRGITDGDATQVRQSRLMALGRAHGLSRYDATYLDLSQRLGASLASFDRRLHQAAIALGVPVYT